MIQTGMLKKKREKTDVEMGLNQSEDILTIKTNEERRRQQITWRCLL